MPYYRRRYNRRYRRNPYRRRRYYKRKPVSWYTLARKAYSGFKYIRGLVNVEFKKNDLSANSSTSGDIVPFHEIAVGDTDLTRSGNSILAKSLLVRGRILTSDAAGQTRVRVIIFRDKQQVADSDPTQAMILDSTSTDQIMAPLNNETVGRFSVLYDKRFDINQMIASTSVNRSFNYFGKMQSHIRYNGSASTDIQRNGLYLLLVHDQPLNVPTISLEARLRYVDN